MTSSLSESNPLLLVQQRSPSLWRFRKAPARLKTLAAHQILRHARPPVRIAQGTVSVRDPKEGCVAASPTRAGRALTSGSGAGRLYEKCLQLLSGPSALLCLHREPTARADSLRTFAQAPTSSSLARTAWMSASSATTTWHCACPSIAALNGVPVAHLLPLAASSSLRPTSRASSARVTSTSASRAKTWLRKQT